MTSTRLNPKEWVEDVNGWTIRHLVDGRVEMRKSVEASLSYVAWGSVYEALVCGDVAYPYTFASRPAIRVETFYVHGSAIMGFEITARENQTTHFPTVYALRPSNASTTTSVGVGLIATGWPAS